MRRATIDEHQQGLALFLAAQYWNLFEAHEPGPKKAEALNGHFELVEDLARMHKPELWGRP